GTTAWSSIRPAAERRLGVQAKPVEPTGVRKGRRKICAPRHRVAACSGWNSGCTSSGTEAMKIVCAVDFTARSRAAAQVAVDLARRAGGSVELVHVMKPGTVDILAVTADAVVLEEEVRAEVESRLQADCARLSTASVPVTSQVCEGDIETALLARANEVKA